MNKQTTLQDLDRHRPLEIEAIVGVVVELAGWLGIPVPHIQTLYATLKLLENRLAPH